MAKGELGDRVDKILESLGLADRKVLERYIVQEIHNRSAEFSDSRTPEGRVPPQDVNAEMALLGEFIMHPEYFTKMNYKSIEDSDFYKPAHQRIWAAMVNCYEENGTVNLIALAENLRKRAELDKIGGEYYLTQLCTPTLSVHGVKDLATIVSVVKEKVLMRQMISTCAEYVGMAYSETEDFFDLHSQLMTRISQLVPQKLIVTDDMPSIMMRASKEFEGTLQRGGKPEISFGYPEIDDMTLGVRKSRLTYVGARTGSGKTTFAMNVVRNVADQGHAVWMFAEDKDTDLIFKMLAREADIDSKSFVYFKEPLGKDEIERIREAQEKMKTRKIWISNYEPDLAKMVEMIATVNAANPELALVVVDNLQVFKKYAQYRRSPDILKEVMDTFKYNVGNNFNVSVLMLGQLESKVESDKTHLWKRPTSLDDLQDDEANIVEISDNVLFVWNPGHYFPNPTAENIPAELKLIDYAGKVQIIQPKGRMGRATKSVWMGFDPVTSNIYSLKDQNVYKENKKTA